MAKVYKTAMGRQIDVDGLLLTNDHVIAVGNMKVNGRGDELGPGGKVVKTRDQIMKEYYALNTPTATDPSDNMGTQVKQPTKTAAPPQQVIADVEDEPQVVINPDSGLDENDDGPEAAAIVDTPVDEIVKTEAVSATTPKTPAMRGSLASAVAKTATVTQKPRLPLKKANGIQRF